jgi:hypothetical protein
MKGREVGNYFKKDRGKEKSEWDGEKEKTGEYRKGKKEMNNGNDK